MKSLRRYNNLLARTEYLNFYDNKYYNLFMNRYIIEGVSREQRDYILHELWSVGSVWSFKLKGTEGAKDHPQGLLVFTPYSVNGWNIYNYPVQVIPVNTKGVKFIPATSQVVNEDGVIIYAQRNHKSVKEVVSYYTKRLANIEMIIQISLNAQRMPIVIGTSKEDEAKAKELWDIINSDNPELIWSLEMIDKVKALITGAPYVVDKLYNYKACIENELREYLGLDNLGINEKKEHLISNEIEANNEIVGASSDSFLDVIEESFELIRDVLNYDITIRLNKPYKEESPTEDDEVVEDEE